MLLKPFLFFSTMYWLCIGCKAKINISAPLDTPPAQLTLQKIGVTIALKPIPKYLSFSRLVN